MCLLDTCGCLFSINIATDTVLAEAVQGIQREAILEDETLTACMDFGQQL